MRPLWLAVVLASSTASVAFATPPHAPRLRPPDTHPGIPRLRAPETRLRPPDTHPGIPELRHRVDAPTHDATAVSRAPDRLTQAEREGGFHLNRVTTTLAGNSHFPNWWDVVPNDTSIVIAQGRAYEGQTVEVGHERYENAQIIYQRVRAGLREQTHLDVKGAAGEQVRILYYRVGATARLETQGSLTRVLDAGRSAFIGGDAHWRDVRLTIQPTESEHATPVSSFFDYYHPDHYDRTAQQAGRDTRGPKGRNELGGDATEEKAAQRVIDPMFH